MAHSRIKSIAAGSIASEMGLEGGDQILKINGSPIADILDYKYLTADEALTVEVLKADGSVEVIDVCTDYEDLGIEFEDALMDTPKRCRNKCIFCFIDQLPKGMRKTVYFKDDDARLSFLQGNYITLTNLSDDDIGRIIRMRISPVNVSVHTTNPALRIKMLGNRCAGKAYDVMRQLSQNGITLNCQIVLCRGINDGAELDCTIGDLARLYPAVNSVSVVPVGLTAHRDGLFALTPYDTQSAIAVVEQVESWQDKLLGRCGSRVVYLADEFYLLAQRSIPPHESYEGFPQIENGVGLIASMQAEFDDSLEDLPCGNVSRYISIATGELAYPFINGLCARLSKRCKGFHANVYAVKNDFFGGGVTVSGLVCGRDIVTQLSGRDLGEALFIPSCMLRSGEAVFLDDMTLDGLQKALNIKIIPVDNNGYDFTQKLLGISTETRF